MDLKLSSKRVFVSGSTQGIGLAIARQFLNEKAEVVINGRQPDKTQQVVCLLKNEFPDAIVEGIAADLSSVQETALLLRQLGNVDILINNVGLFELKEFKDITDDDWHAIFNSNVMSAVRLSRQLLPHMLEKKWGRIIFISSESGVNIPENMIHYGMTKAAMMAISNGLSKLTKGTAVTINTLLGGPVYSDGVAATVQQIAQANGLSENQMKEIVIQQTNPHSLLQRFIEPAEIAYLAAYIASPLSVATNGACVRADGGVLRTV